MYCTCIYKTWRVLKLPADLFPPDHSFKNESDEKFEELQKLRIRVAELESELGIKKGSNSLKFKVDHLFAVGSPLGMFLMLREHSPLVKESKGADSLLPSAMCKRIHNVHHPSDPVVSLVSTIEYSTCSACYCEMSVWYLLFLLYLSYTGACACI